MNQVIKKLGLGVWVLLLFPFQTLWASPTVQNAVPIYYFYINACESCREAEDLIWNYSSELKSNENLRGVRFFSYEITESENIELMEEFCIAYQVPEDKKIVPLLFAGEGFFSGQDEIADGLKEIKEKLRAGTLEEPLWREGAVRGDEKIRESFDAIKIINILVIGLINGLNPCSLSMLLFFLSLLLAKQDLKIIHIGGAFLVGKFLTYGLLGTFLYSFLQKIDITRYQMTMKVIIGIFVAVMAALNIKDYLSAKQEKYGEIKNQLPSKLRAWNHKIITLVSQSGGRALIFIAGLLGVIVSVGEFLCTGQVYLTTILYMLQSESKLSMKAFVYLMLYSLCFILPGMMVIIVIARTKKIISLSETVRLKMPLIKLLTAGALIVAGVIIIFFT